MISGLAVIWPQPLDPFHSVALSALVAALPLILVLVLMGLFRRSGMVSSASGLGAAILLALLVWRMPAVLVMWSAIYGFVYALFPILWIVFSALWLYNLTQDTGKFELLRRWMGRVPPATRASRPSLSRSASERCLKAPQALARRSPSLRAFSPGSAWRRKNPSSSPSSPIPLP